MSQESDIQSELAGKFSFLRDKIRIPRARRIFADVELKDFRIVFDHVVKDMGFCILCTISGLDEGENLAFVYHVARENGIILSLKTYAPKADPTIRTITDYFPTADIYERELMDLLGAKVEGLAPGRRYPLADDWPKDDHPLRKDWKEKKENNTRA